MPKQDKNVVKLPVDVTEEVIDTPDIQAARANDTDLSILDARLQKQLSDTQADIEDSYAYSGIPSAVARQRMMDSARHSLASTKTQGMVEGFNANEERRQNKLMGLAALTAKRRRSGFESSQKQNSGGGLLSSIIGGAAAAAPYIAMAASDERLKENIQPAEPVLPRLDGVQAYDYQWREDGQPDTGVVAQEMAQSFPEAVVPGNDQQPWMVKPQTEAALALQGLKELNQKVDWLASVAGLTRGRQAASQTMAA